MARAIKHKNLHIHKYRYFLNHLRAFSGSIYISNSKNGSFYERRIWGQIIWSHLSHNVLHVLWNTRQTGLKNRKMGWRKDGLNTEKIRTKVINIKLQVFTIETNIKTGFLDCKLHLFFDINCLSQGFYYHSLWTLKMAINTKETTLSTQHKSNFNREHFSVQLTQHTRLSGIHTSFDNLMSLIEIWLFRPYNSQRLSAPE